ncbi:MAG: hypothetical protein ACRC2K_11170 [Clostridium sp.]
MFLSDKKILLGIGIGLVLASLLNFSYSYENSVSNGRIEENARGLGMHYSDECKVLFERDDK